MTAFQFSGRGRGYDCSPDRTPQSLLLVAVILCIFLRFMAFFFNLASLVVLPTVVQCIPVVDQNSVPGCPAKGRREYVHVGSMPAPCWQSLYRTPRHLLWQCRNLKCERYNSK